MRWVYSTFNFFQKIKNAFFSNNISVNTRYKYFWTPTQNPTSRDKMADRNGSYDQHYRKRYLFCETFALTERSPDILYLSGPELALSFKSVVQCFTESHKVGWEKKLLKMLAILRGSDSSLFSWNKEMLASEVLFLFLALLIILHEVLVGFFDDFISSAMELALAAKIFFLYSLLSLL